MPRNEIADSSKARPAIGSKATPHSRVSDRVWDYSTVWADKSVPANRKLLNWGFKVSPNERLTDPQHAALLSSGQNLLHVAQIGDGKPWKPATVHKGFVDLKHLIRYMVARRIKSFAAMSPAQGQGFIAEVMVSDLSPGRRLGRLRLLDLAYHYRGSLRDALTFDPYFGSSSFEVGAPDRAELRLRRTDTIPDKVATELIQKAAELVGSSGRWVEAHRDREFAVPVRGSSRAAHDRARRRAVQAAGIEDGLELTRMITLIRTACLIIVHFFSGVRKGEAASFTADSIELDEDGSVWCAGHTFKIRERDDRWQVPPVVETAVSVAARIAEPYGLELELEKDRLQQLHRSSVGSVKEAVEARIKEIDAIKRRIFLTPGGPRTDLAYEGGSRISVLTNTYSCLREFVSHFDIRHEGELWPLATHQFRPTFARFMAANLMNFRYLQEHFKHVSPDMTAWYDSTDLEMTALIAEFYEKFKLDVLDSVLSGEPVVGKGAAQIRAEQAQHFRGIASNENFEAFRSKLGKALHFKSTGISYCLGIRDRGMCGGVVGCMLDPRNVVECENAFAPPEFLPAWERMERRCIKALEAPDLGVSEKKVQQELLDQTIRPIIEHLRGGRTTDEG